MIIDNASQNVFNSVLVQKKNSIVLATDIMNAFEQANTNEKADLSVNQSIVNQSIPFGSQIKSVLAIQVNLEAIGYALSPELIQALSYASEAQLTSFYGWVMPFLQQEVGAHRSFEPMYPNFPKQVMEASDAELLINALMHYTGDWFGVRILPHYEKLARLPLVTERKPKVLQLASYEQVEALFVALISSNTSLSSTDKEHVKTLFNAFIKQGVDVSGLFEKAHISQKETLAHVSGLVLNTTLDFMTLLGQQFKTPTDVLRLAVSLSDGDISLSKDTKFKNIKRSQRRLMLSLLENTFVQSSDHEQLLDNMYSYREAWIRLAEKLHAGEYTQQYPHAVQAIQVLRNQSHNLSYNGQIEVLFENKQYAELIEHLSQRPGVFARHLNRVLREINEMPKAQSHKVKPVKKVKEKAQMKNMFHETYQAEIAPLNNPFGVLKGKFSSDSEQEKSVHSDSIKPVDSHKEVSKEHSVLNIAPITATQKVQLQGSLGEQEKANLVQKTIEAFSQVASKVSTPVLLQVYHHFNTQHEKSVRAFLPKGVLSKAYVVDTSVPALQFNMAKSIANVCEDALVTRFKSLPALGKVFIDPLLKQQHVPFAMRSASKALHTLSRGSRIPTEDTDVTRFFIWWNESFVNKDGHKDSVGRVDLDLSCVLLDENFRFVTHCSWTNLRDSGMTHSGDITSAPNGACEFIDIERSRLDPRAQYVVMTVNSYTMQHYCDLPECYAGWMERNAPQSGEVFDARTVANKIDLSSETGTVIPMVIDIKNNMVIWTDISMKGGLYNTTENQLSSMQHIIKGMVHLNKPNLYDLFNFHAKARGELVQSAQEADTLFSLNEGITPYDMEVIASEFMADEDNSPKPKIKMK